MAPKTPTMKMPELLVFAKMLMVGFVGAEIFRVAFYLGTNYVRLLDEFTLWGKLVGILSGLALCLTYAIKRDAHSAAARMGRSLRVDLLAAAAIGAWSNELVAPWLSKVHAAFKAADPYWALAVLILLSVVLASSLFQHHWPRPRKQTSQLYFVADEEV